MERAADIYSKFTVEGLANSKGKASASVKRVDYMTVYTSDLVKAVRKAVGNIGIVVMPDQNRDVFGDQNLRLLRLRSLALLFCVH